MGAFKAAQKLAPQAEREKAVGFVLLVGSGQAVIKAGEDRDYAIEKAVEILEENDTVVFVSKLQSKFGKILVTKDQLILTRKVI